MQPLYQIPIATSRQSSPPTLPAPFKIPATHPLPCSPTLLLPHLKSRSGTLQRKGRWCLDSEPACGKQARQTKHGDKPRGAQLQASPTTGRKRKACAPSPTCTHRSNR